MKFRQKSALMVFLLGSALLLMLSLFFYFNDRISTIEYARAFSIDLAKEVAHAVELFLVERGKVTTTIGTAPILTDVLSQSNSDYTGISDSERQEHIDDLNARWMAAESMSDPVVQGVLSNPVADYLRRQQLAFPDEYGEIFVTNRYGTLVASTGKLTTFAHAHKYWWQASYHEGEGKIFFDDRGFDESVEGYVLGLVVPIRQGAEVIGILKCNLNVTDALNHAIKSRNQELVKNFKLVRSGGLVVFDEGVEPLSTSVSSTLIDAMGMWMAGSFIAREAGGDELRAYAPVLITHESGEYGFGGSQMSIDHSQGNQGEGWYVVGSRYLRDVVRDTRRAAQLLAIIGISFGLIMALGSVVLGRTLARPLMALVEFSRRIGHGDFDVEVDITSKDEMGDLARSFNSMARDLRNTMISRDRLAEEVEQRKRVEDALRQSKAKLTLLYDTMTEGICLHEIVKDEAGRAVDYRIIDINSSYERITGITRERAVGSLASELYGTGDPPYIDVYARVAETMEPISFETVYAPLSKVFNISVFSPVQGRFGTVFEDISDRKQAEKDREILQEQLSHAQKMETVGRLAGGVAHDFNNMLGVILGHTELALDQIDRSEPLFTGLQEIKKAADRSADLTRQLLAFARKQTVIPKVLNVDKTVEGMLKMLRRLIGEEIDLAWLSGSGTWLVKMDPSQIDQIMANLCVNARDAIEGVGRVTIKTENITVDKTDCRDQPEFVPGDYVLLTVSDNGCGMEEETLHNLFEPFFTTKEMGSGLGLSTVYGIIRQNNGSINVSSVPGEGTTFKIYLPRYTGDEGTFRAKGSDELSARGDETILLVEDEPALLVLATMLLKGLGYTVLPASAPSDAIRLAGEHKELIHLLITDVVMPEMNGRDLAESLLVQYTSMKCLFMSGYTADVIAQQGVIDKEVNFIQKPFTVQVLAVKVRGVLDGE